MVTANLTSTAIVPARVTANLTVTEVVTATLTVLAKLAANLTGSEKITASLAVPEKVTADLTVTATVIEILTVTERVVANLTVTAIETELLHSNSKSFGEIVTHVILECLKGTKNEWLLDLMKIFAKGDVFEFRKITTVHEKDITAQPALVSRAELVKEKITLLALVNMVFERPSAERTLQFEDIASRTGVEVSKVEWVIMRALSLGLIKGTMDEIDQNVTVSWVMPRVLDSNQLKALGSRFSEWAVKVSKTRDYMGEQNPTFS